MTAHSVEFTQNKPGNAVSQDRSATIYQRNLESFQESSQMWCNWSYVTTNALMTSLETTREYCTNSNMISNHIIRLMFAGTNSYEI